MRNSQRFLVAILFTLGAFSLLLLSNQMNHQAPLTGQAFPSHPTGDFAVQPTASTVTATVTSTITNSQAFPTRLSLTLSSNPVRQSQRFTITLNLLGQTQGQNASLPNQLVSITSSWGSTVNCITQNDGTCHLDINAPNSAGNYFITAKYSGNLFFASSTATINLKVQ
jgi:hypothetical protein